MLPFDAETLFAALAGYHREFAPIRVLAAAASAAAFALAVAGPALSRRLVPWLLAAGWLWVGVAWHFGAFADLNFAAPAYGALFVLQALLLTWRGARGGLAFDRRRGWQSWLGIVLAVAALIGFPLADRSLGFAWDAVRLPGVDPCPTALLTLGVLVLSRPPAVALMTVPVLWTLIAGATGWVLSVWPDQLLPLAAVIALGSVAWIRRRDRSQDLGVP